MKIKERIIKALGGYTTEERITYCSADIKTSQCNQRFKTYAAKTTDKEGWENKSYRMIAEAMQKDGIGNKYEYVGCGGKYHVLTVRVVKNDRADKHV